MRRKHYLLEWNGQEVMRGDIYQLANFLGKSIDTIQKRSLEDGYIISKGRNYQIKMFEQLYQFIDKEGCVIFESDLYDCAEEMCYSPSSISNAACNKTKINNYIVKAVEYLEGYGYYE